MTLVIAGKNLSDANKCFEADSLVDDGLFIVTDSVITIPRGPDDRRVAILDGFKKVYKVPIKLYEPYLINGYFQRYYYTYYEAECFIAIAGSTLTAQHMLNSITNHLNDLQIGFKREYTDESPYKVYMGCGADNNPIFEHPMRCYDDCDFVRSDFEGILTADVVSDVVEHALKASLSSAKKYQLDANSFKQFLTQFILGVYCTSTKKHKLFKYKVEVEQQEEVFRLVVNKYCVPDDKLAVIGMTNRFEQRAQEFYSQINHKPDSALLMYQFLQEAIDEISQEGLTEIGYPSACFKFNGTTLKKVLMHNEKQDQYSY